MCDLVMVPLWLAIGAQAGFMVRDWLAERAAAKKAHQAHMGLYGDPNLAYWFRLRASETDPYWAGMPLREYARLKKLANAEDTE